jgi:glycerol-3-phosphate dehydrogenase
VTHHLAIHGSHATTEEPDSLAVYGSDAVEIRKLIKDDASLGDRLHPALPYIKAEVGWAVLHEMARTVEDVLARRTRALFLNARAAVEMAPAVASLMAPELGWDEAATAKQLAAFRDLAANYTL